MISLFSLSSLLALFLAWQAVPSAEVVDAERMLKEAKVPTDGVGLLAYFRTHTLTEAERARLAQTVRELGSPSFEVREKATRSLIVAGHAARQFLQDALKDRDPEIVHRADNCLQSLEDRTEAIRMAAAARVLAARKPEGAAEALLAYLPSADAEDVEEAVTGALAVVGLQGGKVQGAVTAAVTDREPMRRAAAAFVLGKGGVEYRPVLRQLLGDRSERVRFQAAESLARTGEREAMPVILALLDEAPGDLVYRVEDLLLRAAGEGAPTTGLGVANAAQRHQCRIDWEKWWKANGDKVDLTRINQESPVLGLTVVAEYDASGPQNQGRVWECGADGKVRWEFTNVVNPADVQVLGGGRVLVAETGAGRVSERDRQGKVLWEKAVPNPIACQRLRNGNTFAANYNTLFEFAPDGTQVFKSALPHAGMIYYAQKLRAGNYVYITQIGEIVELDAAGKEIRSFKADTPGNGAGYWSSIEELARGNYLVTLGSAHLALEIDGTGRVVWQCAIENTTGASQLRNGHVLVAYTEGRSVVEFDRSGKEVWQAKTSGRPFRVRRY